MTDDDEPEELDPRLRDPAVRRPFEEMAKTMQANESARANFRDLIANAPEARTARASQQTAELTAAIAENMKATTEGIRALIAAGDEAETRERTMVFWARVAGWAAIAAVLLGVVGIVVTIIVALAA